MAKALKCDACGTFFEVDSSLDCRTYTVYDNDCDEDIDMCPKCYDALCELLKSKEEK